MQYVSFYMEVEEPEHVGVQLAISAHWSAWYLEGPLRSSSYEYGNDLGEMSHVPKAHRLSVSEAFSVLFVPWWSSMQLADTRIQMNTCVFQDSVKPKMVHQNHHSYSHDFQISDFNQYCVQIYTVNMPAFQICGTWKINLQSAGLCRFFFIRMDCQNMNGLVMYMST